MAMKDTVIRFRAPSALVERIEAAASLRGVTASAYLREVADRDLETFEDEDAALAQRVAAGAADATAELLGLNVASLVHRYSLGDPTAGTLILALAAIAPPEKSEALVCALVAALDQMQRRGVEYSSIETLSELNGRRIERSRRKLEAA